MTLPYPPNPSIPFAQARVRNGTRVRHLVGRWVFRLFLIGLLFQGVGRSAPDALTQRDRAIARSVDGYAFNLVAWEAAALARKAQNLLDSPLRQISPADQPALVQDYLDAGQRMGELEGEINRLLAENQGHTTPDSQSAQDELERLRQGQISHQRGVEAIIQRQVSEALGEAGFDLFGVTAPPVQFAFVEPPKKLIVSPRDKIETVYGHMVSAEIPLAQIEAAEARIYTQQNLSAYVTNIGGLGAYPAIVVDRYGLEWTITTVAHEWVHNYLTFFPLGFNYGATGAITTLNETVADIVGNEIGLRVLRRYYPDRLPPEAGDPAIPLPEIGPNHPKLGELPVPQQFSFGAEMRVTRLVVDRLLNEGKIVEAEAYMERQRQMFVRRGYALRVLNQAYFAFHGSYATGAFSIDPIGPKLQMLYQAIPDLYSFVATIRSITTVDELDLLLAKWNDDQAR